MKLMRNGQCNSWIGAFGEVAAGIVYFSPQSPRVVLCAYWGAGNVVTLVATTTGFVRQPSIEGAYSCCLTRKDEELEYIQRRVRIPDWVTEADVVLFDEEDSTLLGLMEVKTTTKPRPMRSFHCQSGWANTEREARTRGVPTWLGIVKLNPALLCEEVILDPPEEVFRRAIATNRLTEWVSEVCVYGPDGFEILDRKPGVFVTPRSSTHEDVPPKRSKRFQSVQVISESIYGHSRGGDTKRLIIQSVQGTSPAFRWPKKT